MILWGFFGPGAPEGSGFKASQKTGSRVKSHLTD